MNIMEHGIYSERSQGLIDFAYSYAKEAHEEVEQLRDYTKEPYIVHPIAVAKLVSHVTFDCNMISAALLHDVIEDTNRTYEDLRDNFGKDIIDLVWWLSDKSNKADGNRAKRKEIDRNHIAKAPRQAKTIKIADLIDNSHSIERYNPAFARKYMEEKWLLLYVLMEGDVSLFSRALAIIQNYRARITL